LLDAAGPAQAEQRLPLVELAFPTLKQRPPSFILEVLETVDRLVEADGRTDVFEYLLARSLSTHVWASQNPGRVRMSGKASLGSSVTEVAALLAVLAKHGNDDVTAAAAAYAAGLKVLDSDVSEKIPELTDWVSELDRVLPVLDGLRPNAKERLVRAMAAVVMHDGKMAPSELELLRVVCDLIHVPLPLLTESRRISPQS
jgi:uncharacterized tellurite resistance protein B-like protein